jgi:prevent-host-death family protein
MFKTQVRPSRDLRNNYAEIVKTLKEHDHIIITNNGVGESVLINIEDYAKYEEFLHERYVYEKLQKSKVDASSPERILHSPESVFARIDKKLESRKQ